MRKHNEAIWLTRMTPAFVACMIVCVISVFEGYWWKDSFVAIWQSFIAVSLVHILLTPYVRGWILYGLDLILTALLVVTTTGHRYVSLGDDVALITEIGHYISTILPLIGIVSSLVLAQLVLSRKIRTKKQLGSFFAVCLLILCICDSFSPLRLWWAIALLIVTFLVWHTLLHLAQLQLKSKDNMNILLHKPLSILIPLLAVISIMLLVSTNLPSRPPLLEDPYALWMKSKGIKVQINSGETFDKGPSLAVNSLLDRQTSGYSRSDRQLGGGFNFDYTPIMTVKTSHKSYWRGESRSYYDGFGWSNNESDRQKRERENSVVIVNEQLSSIDRPLASTIPVEQEVTFLSKMPVPVLFGAAQINKVTALSYMSPQAIAEAGESGRVNPLDQIALSDGAVIDNFSWTPNNWSLLLYGDGIIDANIASYSLESEVLVIDHAQLNQANATMVDESSLYENTRVPNIVPSRVEQLALEITKDATSDYEAVLMLEKYLKENFRYTNQPDLSKLTGSSVDFVDQFLFELQEGYCDYFSTAMVIMARTLDYPARWVKGFSSGISDMEQAMSEGQMPNMQYVDRTDTSGTYTVRNADAHSWVEIYFEGFGWIAFEPTPGFSFPYTNANNEDNPLLQLTPEPPSPSDAAVAASVEKTKLLPAWLMWVIAIVWVLIMLALLVKYRAVIIKRIKQIRYRRYTTNELIIVELKGFLAFCHRIGLERNGNLTMRETINGWDFGSAAWRSDVQQLLHLYERAHYSREQLTPQHVQQAQKLIISLKKNWNS